MNGKTIRGPELQYNCKESVGELFFKCAEQFSDKICQIDATSDQKETYSSVKIRSVRAALELQNRGVTSKDVVALCTKVTLDNVIPIVASFFLGAKVANLEPALSVLQTTHLLSLLKPKIIFVEEESLTLIEDSLEGVNLEAELVIFGNSTKYATFSDFVKPQTNEDIFKPTKIDVHETAIIMFSSGTTGFSKAICHSSYSFLNMVYAGTYFGLRCEIIIALSCFFWIAAPVILALTFITGGHRIFCRSINAENIFKMIEKYKATVLSTIPSFTFELTNFEHYREYDTSSLRSLTIVGSSISNKQLQKVRQVFKHTAVMFGYGSTETGGITSFHPIMDEELMKTKLGSCGKASPGITLKVVDISTNEPVGPHQKGEICVKSPAVMTGYYNGDSSTVFDSEGFLKTGDVGYYDDDGCLYVIDRLKEMFKYLIWHIVPSAIEQVLLEHPAIEEVVVFGTPSEEEGELPTACVVLKEGVCVDKEEIEKYVAAKVADHEKLRGGVVFVDDLEKTLSGKLMRKQIRNMYLQSLKI